MSHHFSSGLPAIGAKLQANTFGRLVAEFKFSSHVPLRGGRDTGRHIYLILSVATGPSAGVFECAVNIRSDEGTEVLYTTRHENLDSGLPDAGFDASARLAYGSGADASGTLFMGLTDADFQQIENDDLYNRVSDLAQSCQRIAVYGITYSGGDGIHDTHMNSGTKPGDPHARDDHPKQDGAMAFYFDLESDGRHQTFVTWVFVKFTNQKVVDY